MWHSIGTVVGYNGARFPPDLRERVPAMELPDELEQIPNVGPAIARKLRQLGKRSPSDLDGQNPYELYDKLCRLDGTRHDPCLLDVFIAAVDFVGGGPARPWWKYTTERKKQLASRRED